jgi:hypothetical protein
MSADLRADDRVDVSIRVELASGHFRQIPAILERRSDTGALQVCGDTGWLQTEESEAGQWLVLYGSDPVELARAIDAQRWGAWAQ